MKKPIDSLIEKRERSYVKEGFIASLIRDGSQNIIAALVTLDGKTTTIPTSIQELFVHDMVEVLFPFGDEMRASIVSKSKAYGDFTHHTVGLNAG